MPVSDLENVVALTRFGFGVSPGSREALGDDPRAALLSQLSAPPPAPDPALPNTRAAISIIRETDLAIAELRRESASLGGLVAAHRAANNLPPAPTTANGSRSYPNGKPPDHAVIDGLMLAEAEHRLDMALKSPAPLFERLVTFWSNHFSVATDKDDIVMGTVGAFEREAIRPHVLGRFEDMLVAVTRHPAMLVYLDNHASVGPNSPVGLKRGLGLNENFGRELLELHTIGVQGQYTQSDVTAFARVLTGWTYRQPNDHPDFVDAFHFNAGAHEPGDQTIMGKVYPDGGAEQGIAVLHDLAYEPATARHLAEKLARHFVADQPPASLVERLAARFLDTGGDLAAVARALVEAPESWAAPRQKLTTPYEFMVGIGRATGALPADTRGTLRALQAMGQPLWRPPAPKGFSDNTQDWLGPEGIRTRLDLAVLAGRKAGMIANPTVVAANLFGSVLSGDTRQSLDRSETEAQGLALFFMSPEFQRR